MSVNWFKTDPGDVMDQAIAARLGWRLLKHDPQFPVQSIFERKVQQPRYAFVPPNAGNGYQAKLYDSEHEAWMNETPKFSTDIDLAMELLHQLRHEKWSLVNDRGIVDITIEDTALNVAYTSNAQLAWAICRCWLQWKDNRNQR